MQKSKVKEPVFLIPEGKLKGPKDNTTLVICVVVLVLSVVGLLNLYSASVISSSYFYNQLLRTLIGFGVFIAVGWFVPIRTVNSYAYWIYGITCVMLLFTVLFGYTAGGAQRWLNLGIFSIQPSEFAKITVAIIVAHFFYSTQLQTAYKLRDLWPIILMVGIIFALIFKQPDLGTAGICLIIAGTQFLFIRLDKRSIWIVLIFAFTIAFIGWNFLLHDYQRLRILNLLNPDLDPHGSGYNSIQSLVAAGSGMFWGKGYMNGTQTQLFFLPARHTDFVFSVFAEEHGFIGCIVVFFLFGFLIYKILKVARGGIDTFSALLAVGMGASIFVDFCINIAMVLGLFPVVGIPLPFFSYGGSALVTNFIALGFVIAIHRQSQGLEILGQELLNKRP